MLRGDDRARPAASTRLRTPTRRGRRGSSSSGPRRRSARSSARPAAERFIRSFGVTPAGNFDGRNILFVPRARTRRSGPRCRTARAKLYAARARRIPPARDDKILAALERPDDLGAGARRAASSASRATRAPPRAPRTSSSARCGPGGLLARSFKDGRAGPARASSRTTRSSPPGCSISTRRPSIPAGCARRWRSARRRRRCSPIRRAGGWFATGAKHETLLAREKPTYDGAIPSGTSVAILNALRAATFTGDDHWRAIADRAFGVGIADASHDRAGVHVVVTD